MDKENWAWIKNAKMIASEEAKNEAVKTNKAAKKEGKKQKGAIKHDDEADDDVAMEDDTPCEVCKHTETAQPKTEAADAPTGPAASALVPKTEQPMPTTTAVVPLPAAHWSQGQGGAFIVPVPGRDGPANSLAGKTIVLTGLFPEVRPTE
jgi:hypothetical protein